MTPHWREEEGGSGGGREWGGREWGREGGKEEGKRRRKEGGGGSLVRGKFYYTLVNLCQAIMMLGMIT